MKKFFLILGVVLLLAVICFFSMGIVKPRLTYTVSFDVNKPVNDVFQAFLIPDTYKEWMTGFDRLEMVSGNPGEVGAKFRLYFKDGDETIIVDEELLAKTTNEYFKFSMDNEVLSGTGEFKFTSKDSMTTITYVNDVAGKGAFWRSILAIFAGSIEERQVGDMKKLKAVIEK